MANVIPQQSRELLAEQLTQAFRDFTSTLRTIVGQSSDDDADADADDDVDYVSPLLGDAPDDDVSTTEEQPEPHKFSSTQLDIEDATCIGGPCGDGDKVADLIRQFSESIPDEELAEDGREENPHITVLYGLHADSSEEVQELVAGFGPVRITLGDVTLFPAEGDKDYDVVKIDVQGDDIHRLHDLLKQAEHTSTYPDYKPHLTIAYVNAGEGQKYVGPCELTGAELEFDKFQFSDKFRKKNEIPLTDDSKPDADRYSRLRDSVISAVARYSAEQIKPTQPQAICVDRYSRISIAVAAGLALRGGFSIARYSHADFDEAQHPRGQPDNAGKFAPKNTSTISAKKADKAFIKPKAQSGEMIPATRVGKGKSAKLVMADGSDVPSHITPAMVPPAWTDVRISNDPHSDVLVVAKDAKGRGKKVYSDAYEKRTRAVKFARVKEGLEKRDGIIQQVLHHRTGPQKENADATWLMLLQATRPGSEEDTKGYQKFHDAPVTSKNIVMTPKKNGSPSVALRFGDVTIPIRDAGAAAEIAKRVQEGRPLENGSYWLKSHGATTLEARHVVKAQDGIRLQFMGKESVWHDHLIRDKDLAAMLEQRAKVGGSSPLFKTNYSSVAKYAKTLDGGHFTPKDWRTMYANTRAISEINKIDPRVITDKKSLQVAKMQVAQHVSGVLGNQPVQALESYIDDAVFTPWDALA